MKGIAYTRKINGENFSFLHNADVENGTFVFKGDLVAGETQIYNALIPTTATLKQKAYLVNDPAWSYDTSKSVNQNRENYVNVAGTAFRGYDINTTNKFDVSVYTIDGVVEVGNYVTLQNGNGRLIAGTAAPASATYGLIGKIERFYEKGHFSPIDAGGDVDAALGYGLDGRIRYAVIEVIQNG